MSDVIESFKNNGCQIELVHDLDPLNPYQEFDTVSKIYHWHPRYDLGNNISRMDEGEMMEYLTDSGKTVLAIMPVYMYDHSGITISTKPFSCRWDSGQVGWVVITKDNADKMGIVDRSLPELEKVIEAEIDRYDHYLTGQVYGYRVNYDGELVDSCYGFYDLADARSEAESASTIDYRPRGVFGQSCLGN
jgi:hypothetical protein